MAKYPIPDLDRLLAALSYVWVLFLIPFIFGYRKPFVANHARQGASLFVFELVLMVIGFVPLLGWVVALAGWFFVCVCSVIGIAHALAGQSWEVPFLRKYGTSK